MTLFVSLVIPLVLWSSYACPLAFVVDFLFGRILRGRMKSCTGVEKRKNITLEECLERRIASGIFNQLLILFTIPTGIAILANILRGLFPKEKGLFTFLVTSSVVFFGLVFVPWFIHEFLFLIPNSLKILLILPTFFLWFSFPLMRRNATLVLVIYIHSFVIYWRIYQEEIFALEYDDNLFNNLMGVSTILLWSALIIGSIQQRTGHVYNRYILHIAT